MINLVFRLYVLNRKNIYINEVRIVTFVSHVLCSSLLETSQCRFLFAFSSWRVLILDHADAWSSQVCFIRPQPSNCLKDTYCMYGILAAMSKLWAKWAKADRVADSLLMLWKKTKSHELPSMTWQPVYICICMGFKKLLCEVAWLLLVHANTWKYTHIHVHLHTTIESQNKMCFQAKATRKCLPFCWGYECMQIQACLRINSALKYVWIKFYKRKKQPQMQRLIETVRKTTGDITSKEC